ncbi:hypothetical protein C8Q76DRAFT_803516 [Earliella scabrosa]|nr:hypothetical protein C8Q76DRAFT_803516 [Earliella scabrosa]
MTILKNFSLATLALATCAYATLAQSRRVVCPAHLSSTGTGTIYDASRAASLVPQAAAASVGLDSGDQRFGYGVDDPIDQEPLVYLSGSGSRSPSRILGRRARTNSLDAVNAVDSLFKLRPNLQNLQQRASRTTPADLRPTPEPTGPSSQSTTVHITDEHDFALILPNRAGELISDAESDGVAFCTPGSTDAACSQRVQEGFIRAAKVETSEDGGYIQVTGCLDTSKSTLDPTDEGGQFDVRYPDGAQCSFGGYGASFIQLVEPALNRFCLRCCSAHDDQVNCNSHQDRAGCETAIPGTYSFPELGVSCE